jgi:hypothetical protein
MTTARSGSGPGFPGQKPPTCASSHRVRSIGVLASSALVFAGPLLAAAQPSRVAIWTDPDLGAQAAVAPSAVGAALEQAGLQIVLLSTADLTNRTKLDAAKTPLMVLPYRACYPAAGFSALDQYLRTGGSYLAFGNERFQKLLFPVNNRWLPLDSVSAPQPAGVPSAPWDLKNHGEGNVLTVTGNGSAASPFRFETPDLKSYLYAGTKPGPLPERGVVLRFEARGSEATRFLCLELQEHDGSRWKHIIELSSDWREYRIHSASFVSYATSSRTNDYFSPAKTKILYFGLIKPFAKGGPQRFDLRNLQFYAADVPSEVALGAGVPLPGGELATRFFGKNIPQSPAKEWPNHLVDGERFAAASLKAAPVHRLSADLPDVQSQVQGRLLLPAASTPRDHKGQPVLLFPEATSTSRLIPLIEACDARGTVLGSAAGLLIHQAGRYAGSAQVVFGCDKLDLETPEQAPLRLLLGRVAQFLADPLALESSPPRFAVQDGQAKVSFAQELRSRSPRPRSVRLAATLAQTNCTPIEVIQTLTLRPRVTNTVTWFSAPLADFNWRAFRAQVGLSRGDLPIDRATYSVEARQALRALCEFFVQRAGSTGKLSGTHYFGDHRGARTLLAGYEIFGEPRYLQTALTWAHTMVAEQRPDGGYRMGYGITSRGESCFVADGGEIALGVTRVTAYVTGTQRQQLLESLRAYMGYRESFRCPGGGIGVGWSLTDYGRRPTVTLRQPARILAPELNPYTIGCSLGAAYLYASLTGRPEDLQSARQDADWYMVHGSKSLSGASAESFALAHALEHDPARRLRYADFLRQRFIRWIADANNSWWLSNGGRATLDLQILNYCRQQLGQDPRLELQMARATSAMTALESPNSIYHLLEKPKLNHDEWFYLCFGGLGLAEVVEPMATYKRIEAQPATGSKY